MQSLVRQDTIWSAAIAAGISATVCYPRLVIWTDRPNALWFLATMLLLVSFILWSFVFAWYPQSVGRAVIQWRMGAGLWALAGLGGGLGGALLLWTVDPVLREVRPGDYPATLPAWLWFTLFNLGFSQLFVCYAAVAFFLRLFRGLSIALGCTVLFGLLLLTLQIHTSSIEFEPAFVLRLYLLRALFGAVPALLFLRGGILPAVIWTLLLESRLLPRLIFS
jgi:hypothetical protein